MTCTAVSEYGGLNRDVVHLMKYSSRKNIALMMGGLMARMIPKPDVDFLVPVPLHKGSEREYNQAELIARGASSVWKVPVLDCLRWKSAVPSQARSLDRAHRVLPDGAISVRKIEPGARVLLVDDVCTTGGTLLAARKPLCDSGAVVVGAVVWSRRSRD
ncbi:MAG: hypothetical protein LBQ36_03955 [Synergistaceae bacterium]|jgi:predicted amidophosphoribosyltransferase|nr:hypothetical protein [Synergistaceae bacterium]